MRVLYLYSCFMSPFSMFLYNNAGCICGSSDGLSETRLNRVQQRIASEAPCPLVANERLLLCRSCVSLLSLLCAKGSHTNDCRCPENVRIVFRITWRTPELLYLFRLLD